MMRSPWRAVGEGPERTYVWTDPSGCSFEYKEEGGQHRSSEAYQEAAANNPGKQQWGLGPGRGQRRMSMSHRKAGDGLRVVVP